MANQLVVAAPADGPAAKHYYTLDGSEPGSARYEASGVWLGQQLMDGLNRILSGPQTI